MTSAPTFSACFLKRLFGSVCASLFLCWSAAQEIDVSRAPQQILFDDWRQVAQNPVAIEYRVQFLSAAHSGVPHNDTIRLRAFLPAQREGSVPVVITLHYWGAVNQKLEEELARSLVQRGIASVLLALPYHLDRAPPGKRSGEMALRPDPAEMVRTMNQAVLDVRRTVDWIQSRPEFSGKPIGITGASLGAIISALVVGVEPRLKHSAFVLGGVDLAHILWNSSRVVRERETMRKKGYTEDKLRQELAPIEPLNRLAQTSLESSLVIAARHDTVVPTDDARKLIAALKQPYVVWTSTGHYGGFMIQKKIHRVVTNYFDDVLESRPHVPPQNISAPVARIGVFGSSEAKFQVALGLELWRFNPRGDGFLIALATPRGVNLFLGVQGKRGLSVGLSVGTRSVGVGALWSIIL